MSRRIILSASSLHCPQVETQEPEVDMVIGAKAGVSLQDGEGSGCQALPRVRKDMEYKNILCFPGGPVDKNLPASAWDTGLIPSPGIFHMLQSN